MDLARIARIAKVTDRKVFDSARQVYRRFQSIYKTILSYYCLKCRKDTESKNPKVVKTKNGRIILLSKCAVCDNKNLSGILRSLGIKTPLSKIPLVGLLLFQKYLTS